MYIIGTCSYNFFLQIQHFLKILFFSQRARDLFLALWVPDLFMKRVKEYGDWCLMCPNESPGLADCWGEEFENLYMRYEAEGKYRKKVKAQDLWKAIVESQIETGTPYMLYKDACNRKTNHQNLGTIKCSNLCTEIVEYSSPDEVNYNLTKYYKYIHYWCYF